MKLIDRVNQDIADAMRAQDRRKLVPLRMLKSALVNRQVEKGRDLDEPESQQVVVSLVKQRRDSIEQFERGARPDLAAREAAEILVLEAYLPPAAGEEVIDRAIAEAIAETGATSIKDLGRVMKVVMLRLAGQTVDGRQVNERVRLRLGA